MFIGLDLKKWSSWLLGFYGFLSGFLFGLVTAGVPLGLRWSRSSRLWPCLVVSMTRWHRQKIRHKSQSLVITGMGKTVASPPGHQIRHLISKQSRIESNRRPTSEEKRCKDLVATQDAAQPPAPADGRSAPARSMLRR